MNLEYFSLLKVNQLIVLLFSVVVGFSKSCFPRSVLHLALFILWKFYLFASGTAHARRLSSGSNDFCFSTFFLPSRVSHMWLNPKAYVFAMKPNI